MQRKATFFLFLLLLFFSFNAFANPQGPQVVHGQAGFINPDTGTLHVINSPNAIINWQGFSIQQNEITRFIQESASSAVLNRVTGPDPSNLFGQLLSNGRLFLINPNGIVFGPDSVIDTAGFVASTLNMTDQDFLEGNLHFEFDPDNGSILNQGIITAGKNGDIYLIAPNIENSGIIHTDGGNLLLAAGESITITSLDTKGVHFEIQASETEALNLGKILAEGGATGIFAGTLRHSGEIRADSVSLDETGAVILSAANDITLDAGSAVTANGQQGGNISVESENGTTLLSGIVEATGSEGRGGEVRLLGERVGLIDNALIDASGETGGGEILIGGDYQGNNPDIRNASATYIGPDVHIKADADTAGDGGRVIVWSEDATRFYGSISARGGEQNGYGGLVETSGAYLDVFGGRVDTTGPKSDAGTWLLDPYNIDINDAGSTQNVGTAPAYQSNGLTASIDVDDLRTALTSNNVSITTGYVLGAEDGEIRLTVDFDYSDIGSTARTLTLNAHDDIILNGRIYDSQPGTEVLNLVLNANSAAGGGTAGGIGMVDINSNIVTGGGSFTSSGVNFDNTGGSIATLNGDISINHTGNTILGAALSAGAGDVVISGDAGISGSGISVATYGGLIQFDDAVALTGTSNASLTTGADAGGNIVFSNTLDAASIEGQGIDITAGTGSVTFNGAVGLGTRLGAFTINSASGGVTTSSTFAANTISIVDGGTIDLNGSTGADSIYLAGNIINIDGAITTLMDDLTLVPASGFATNVNAGLDISGDIVATGGSGVVNFTNSPTINATNFNAGTMNIFTGTVTLNATSSASILNLSGGGTLTGDDTLTITDTFNWSAGTISGSGTMTLSPDTDLYMTTTGSKTLSERSLTLEGGGSGTRRWGDDLEFGGTFYISNGALLTNNQVFTIATDYDISYIGSVGSITNNGTIQKTAGTDITTIAIPLVNTGTGSVSVNSATLSLSSNFSNFGQIIVNSGTVFAVTATDFINEENGIISGTGTIQTPAAGLINNGTIAAGLSPGKLTIDGNLTLNSTSTIDIELGGTTQGANYDWIDVTGTANLNGTLNVSLYDGFNPAVLDTFQIITCGVARNGTFAVESPPAGKMMTVNYNTNDVTLSNIIDASSFNQWILADNGDWNVPGNWTLGIPISTQDVEIDLGSYIITVPVSYAAEAGTLMLGPNNSLSLLNGSSLDVATSATINGYLSIIGGVFNAAGTADISGSLLVQGGSGINEYAAMLADILSVSNDSIQVLGGTGEDAYALVQAPTMVINADSLLVQAGSGNGAFSSLFHNNTAGTQQISVQGDISVIGGSGTASNAIAQISSQASQQITATGDINIQGGSGSGTYNRAWITAADLGGTGTQTITANNLFVKGGTSTGGNSLAGLESNEGQQTVNISNLIGIEGGNNGIDNDAVIISESGQTVTATDFKILGGTSGTNNMAYINNFGGNQTLTAGNGILMEAGADGEDNWAHITAGTGSVEQTVTTGAAGIQLFAGSGIDNDARMLHQGSGNQMIIMNDGGDLTLQGGSSGSSNEADIRSDTGSVTVQEGDGSGLSDITLFGGIGAGTYSNRALIRSTASADQDLMISIDGSLKMYGGAGVGSDSNQVGISAPRDITIVAGTDFGAEGGESGNNNYANISTSGGALIITAGNGFTVQGGAGGIDNFARISHYGDAIGTDQIISAGAGGISILGGGTSMTGSGYAAHIFDAAPGNMQRIQTSSGGDLILMGGTGNNGRVYIHDGGAGTQELDIAGDLLIGGGSGSGARAIIDSDTPATIDVSGRLDLSGGTGADSIAFLGNDGGPATILLNIDDVVELTGGSGADAYAKIGTDCDGCTTDTIINGGSSITLSKGGSNAWIGSVNGAGSLAINAGLLGTGSIVLNDGLVQLNGNASLQATAPGGTITQDTAGVINIYNKQLTLLADAGIDMSGSNTAGSIIPVTNSGGLLFHQEGDLIVNGLDAGGGNVSLIATGSVTQTNPIINTDLLTVTAGDSISLSNPGNAISGFSASTPADPVSIEKPITIVNGSSLALGSVIAWGPAHVEVLTGSITDDNGDALNIGADRVVLKAPGNIGALSDQLELDVNSLSAINASGEIGLDSAHDIIFGSAAGDSRFTDVTGDVLVTAPNMVFNDALTLPGAIELRSANEINIDYNLTAEGITLFPGTVVNLSANLDAGTGTIDALGGTGIVNFSGDSTVNGASFNTGTLNISSGLVTMNALSSIDTLNLSGGALASTGGLKIKNVLDWIGGDLSITGDYYNETGAVFNAKVAGPLYVGTLYNNGTLSIGGSPGTLIIAGNYVQGSTGSLNMELGGPEQGVDYDWLNITGSATLDGTLNVALFGGFTPEVGDLFDVITYSSVTGDFGAVNIPDGYFFLSGDQGTFYRLEVTGLPSPALPFDPFPNILTMVEFAEPFEGYGVQEYEEYYGEGLVGVVGSGEWGEDEEEKKKPWMICR